MHSLKSVLGAAIIAAMAAPTLGGYVKVFLPREAHHCDVQTVVVTTTVIPDWCAAYPTGLVSTSTVSTPEISSVTAETPTPNVETSIVVPSTGASVEPPVQPSITEVSTGPISTLTTGVEMASSTSGPHYATTTSGVHATSTTVARTTTSAVHVPTSYFPPIPTSGGVGNDYLMSIAVTAAAVGVMLSGVFLT